MDASLKVDLTLKIEDGLGVKLTIVVPVHAGNLKELREAVRENVEMQSESLMDALQKQMDATLAAYRLAMGEPVGRGGV